MALTQQDQSYHYQPITVPNAQVADGPSPWLHRIILLWIMGLVFLLPINFLKLPGNITLVDCWAAMGLPVFWLFYSPSKQVISLYYTVAIWIVFVASFISTFAAPAPLNGLLVILKEGFAFAWFVTLTAALTKMRAKEYQLILVVWSVGVFLHGLIVIAQFLSPAFWQFTVSLSGRVNEYEIYRPTGLFTNANWASYYQLLGFVPVMLVSPSKKVAMILGVLLFTTMIVPGSMGATLAFFIGLVVAVMVVALTGHAALIAKMVMQLVIALLVVGGVLFMVVSQNQQYKEHFTRIFLGRAERSSDGRFYLWQRGMDAMVDYGVFVWGVGPENFREIDYQGKQLHNDTIAFLVERGLLGTFGLGLFAILSVSRAIYLIVLRNRYPNREKLIVAVFLAAAIAAIIESLTHQVFHFRALWVVLAFQEATLYKMMQVQIEATIQATPLIEEGEWGFSTCK